MKQILTKVREDILSNNIDSDTLQRFMQLFNNKSQEAEVKHLLHLHLNNTTDYKEPFSNNLSFKHIWDIILQNKKEKQRGLRIKLQWKRAAVAASILLIMGLVGFLSTDFILTKKRSVVFNGVKGVVTQTTLPDNSIVYLNSDSEIEYNTHTWSRKREVTLKGEAFFNVTHNQDKEFVVHTSGYDIQVLGTRFNVKDPIDGNNVVTTLRDGSIRINKAENSCGTFAPMLLKPYEQMVFDKNNCKFEVSKVESMKDIAWGGNTIVLKNSNFGELVNNLELKYGVEIIVADSTLLAFHYNGTIINETIEEVMTIIAMTMPIKYNLNENKMIIKTVEE